MKFVIGALLCLAGFALGAYVGLWVCFVGGIIDIINQVKAPEVDATVVAWGVVKIIFASFAGSISAIALLLPGAKLIAES